MEIKLVRDGRFVKKVLFDSELVGTITQTTGDACLVWSRKDGDKVASSFDDAVGMFTKYNWRSIVGASPLQEVNSRCIVKSKHTKQRWAIR